MEILKIITMIGITLWYALCVIALMGALAVAGEWLWNSVMKWWKTESKDDH